MNDDFRNRVQGIADKGLNIMEEYFDGKRQGVDMVKEASHMIREGVKIEHMNQLRKQSDKSLAIRLLKFLPDDDTRKEYIKMTHPDASKLLDKG